MKKICIGLFILMMSLCHPEKGFSALPVIEAGQGDFYDYFLRTSENSVQLNLDLLEGIYFDDNYHIRRLETALWCQVTGYPIEGYSFISSDGFELTQITFDVTVTNTEDPFTLSYRVRANSTYQKINEEGLTETQTYSNTSRGTIDAPPLDLYSEPDFFTYTDQPNWGFIIFNTL
jgi:hypothetical protein